MKSNHGVIALYESHEQAEEAIKTLQHNGYDMRQLSIIGKGYHSEENVIGYYNMGERVQKWGSNGAFWGGIWGLLFGSAFFLIPGVGPLLIAGPFVASLVGALEGALAIGGISALGAALYSIGIPENTVFQYETEIKSGKFMLLVHGDELAILNAKSILNIPVPA